MTTTAQLATTTIGRSHFDGQVLTPGSDGYDSARSVWNGMIDHRPKLIVRCASVGDVVTAVRTARECDLEIGVRCGGHNIAGLAVPHGGLMIDLTALGRVTVDPVARRARVQGGAMLGALDRATQPIGLATTAGNVSHTGVGGLTLGGGMGWLARQHGLTCDNVVSCTVVTADGDVVRASADERPDLFWGLRGGGGNFGIVVEFEFRLHPVGTRTLVAELTFPLDRAAAALRGWRDLAEEAPRQATLTADISGDTATLGYVWVGDPEAGLATLPALRSVGVPHGEVVRDRRRVRDLLPGFSVPVGHVENRDVHRVRLVDGSDVDPAAVRRPADEIVLLGKTWYRRAFSSGDRVHTPGSSGQGEHRSPVR